MTEQEKQLLLVDLSARLPYGVKIKTYSCINNYINNCGETIDEDLTFDNITRIPFNSKPYLRPMSSMTEEEEDELIPLFDCLVFDSFDRSYIPDEKLAYRAFDWLNAHHFDYRGLIEKGLALEAPEGMYCTHVKFFG